MQDNRTLLIGGVGLIRGRVRDAGAIMVEICDELEPLLRSIGYTDQAPFKTVSLVLRFGNKTQIEPEYGHLDIKHSEMPVSIELEMSKLQSKKRDEIKRDFMIATLSVLIAVARSYGLREDALADRLANLLNNEELS
jgi:hypothetical protein